ncbi:MAG: hypothetical protein V1775_10070 [Bacteroidota bacterium]
MMEVIKFKTNLKCNGCISAVTPFLDAVEGLGSWEVDLTTPDRVMNAKVDSEGSIASIITAFENAGYKASVL